MNRTSALPVALLAVAIAFGASACGNDGPESASESTADGSAPETTESAGTTEAPATSETPGTATPADEPTVESATDVVVGLIEDDAATAAEDHGWTMRVTRRDGQDLPVTLDFRPDRVNVEVTDGEVTAVLTIG